MRPVQKKSVGEKLGEFTILAEYKPYQTAKQILVANLGEYCSYCERPVGEEDIEVEHVEPKSLVSDKEFSWDNFLLSCKRCNGRDNKGNKPVALMETHFPHKDNTLLSICYTTGGMVKISPNIPINSHEYQKAKALIDLVGLDKRPGHPQFLAKDKRWSKRREVWELATRYLEDFESENIKVQVITDLALSRGFFSVWFTVFNAHKAVKKALIQAFAGTADCFDPHCTPIPRPTNDF